MAGQPWQASGEWLSEVIMWLVFRVAGWSGVVVLAAVSMASAMLIVGLTSSRKLGGLPLLIVLALSASVFSHFGPSARPFCFVLPVTVGFVGGRVVARDRNQAPSLWLAALMVAWVNMHGSFVLGLALIGPFALEAVIEASPGERRRAAVQWGLFAIVALLAALCNPYGVDALTYPFRLTSIQALRSIEEWSVTDLGQFYNFDAFLVAWLLSAFALPIRMPLGRAIIVILLGGMALTHIRHVALLVLIVPMVLAGPLAKAIEQGRRVVDWRRVTAVATVALGIVAVCFGAERLVVPFERGDSPMWPGSAVKAVPAEIRARRVINEVNFGGYLIFEGIAPSFDARLELYGNALQLTIDYDWLDESYVDWTLTVPDSPVNSLLDHDPKWVRIYADQLAVVHVRKSVWDVYRAGAKSRAADAHKNAHRRRDEPGKVQGVARAFRALSGRHG